MRSSALIAYKQFLKYILRINWQMLAHFLVIQFWDPKISITTNTTNTVSLLKNFIFYAMTKIENRICIKTKDVTNITGYSERHARNLLNDIKVFCKKEKHQPVTIYDFSKFMNIPLEQLKHYLI